MTVRIKNWARIYLRRSTSAQESSLETQLQWAIGAAKRYGVPLRASLDDLTYMQLHRLTHYKDIYLDDAVSGSRTKRPAFDAMIAEVKADSSISHVFAFKRDRFGRPKDPVDMMVIDRDLKAIGVMIVMSDGVIDPSRSSKNWSTTSRSRRRAAMFASCRMTGERSRSGFAFSNGWKPTGATSGWPTSSTGLASRRQTPAELAVTTASSMRSPALGITTPSRRSPVMRSSPA